MGELTVAAEQKTISSLEIAEIVGREHKEVLRDIRNIKVQLDESKIALISYFTESTYTDDMNRTKPCFNLTKKGCELYATRMTGAKGTLFAVAYIERFNEMEQQLNRPSYMIEDPIERAQQWIREQQEKQQIKLEKQIVQQQLAEAQPKLSYVDTVLNCPDLLTITKIADDYGMSARAFNQLLKEHNIQYKQSGQWLLYAKFKSGGYTKSETTSYKKTDGTDGINLFTKWTQKGRLFLYETLKGKGILPTMERELEEA